MLPEAVSTASGFDGFADRESENRRIYAIAPTVTG